MGGASGSGVGVTGTGRGHSDDEVHFIDNQFAIWLWM